MGTRVSRHIRQNVYGILALFLVLTGGTAQALSGSNTVFSDDIVDRQVRQDDLAGNSVVTGKIADGQVQTADVLDGDLRGGDIRNNTITGNDVNESLLGQVPSALLGGFGRSSGNTGSCDPGVLAYVVCNTVALDLPSQARVLLIGYADGSPGPQHSVGLGTCRLGTSVTGAVPGTEVDIKTANEGLVGLSGEVTLAGVTPPLGPGNVSFGVDCIDGNAQGEIRFDEVGITAVALAPN